MVVKSFSFGANKKEKSWNYRTEFWTLDYLRDCHCQHLSLLSRRPYSGDGKPPRERPNGPARPWFCSEPHRPGSSSTCHAPQATWPGATRPGHAPARPPASCWRMAGARGAGTSGLWHVASRGRARATRFRAKPGVRWPIWPFPGRLSVAGVWTAWEEREVLAVAVS